MIGRDAPSDATSPERAATARDVFESPVGPLLIEGVAEGVTRLGFDAPHRTSTDARAERASGWGHVAQLCEELTAYFAGELHAFSTPLSPIGTPFQRRVWGALVEIPFGATVSYEELAERAGRPGASRAAGSANGANPIAIVIPCHRVIRKDGSIGGYGGGLERKRLLLALEGAGAGERALFTGAAV